MSEHSVLRARDVLIVKLKTSDTAYGFRLVAFVCILSGERLSALALCSLAAHANLRTAPAKVLINSLC